MVERDWEEEESSMLYYYHCIFASIRRKTRTLASVEFGHSGCIYILIHATLLDEGGKRVVQGSRRKK
jgi:hypothetical protein